MALVSVHGTSAAEELDKLLVGLLGDWPRQELLPVDCATRLPVPVESATRLPVPVEAVTRYGINSGRVTAAERHSFNVDVVEVHHGETKD